MLLYKITNKINGKKYFGQTILKTPVRRWQRHCSKKEKSVIAIAIQKYGKDNFSFEILEFCSSIEELNKREEESIKENNTLTPNGYNVRPGGGNHSQPEIVKEKIGEANAGSKNGWFGKKTIHSKETKRKISEAKKGVSNPKSAVIILGRTKENYSYLTEMGRKQSLKYKGSGNPNAKSIKIDNKEYSTMKEASIVTGLSMYKLRKFFLNLGDKNGT